MPRTMTRAVAVDDGLALDLPNGLGEPSSGKETAGSSTKVVPQAAPKGATRQTTKAGG